MFQLNVLVWSVYLSVALLAYAAVKRYPNQIYSIIRCAGFAATRACACCTGVQTPPPPFGGGLLVIY